MQDLVHVPNNQFPRRAEVRYIKSYELTKFGSVQFFFNINSDVMSTNPHFNDEDDLVAGYTFNPDQHANERRGTHTHTHTPHTHTCY